MKTYLDCIPCFMNQVLRAGRLATDDPAKIKRLLDETGSMIAEVKMENPPPETAALIYGKIRQITGIEDIFREKKIESTRRALDLYPLVKERIGESGDRLMAAVRAAIAGNVIDFGVGKTFSVEHELEDIFTRDFAVCDYEPFREALDGAERVLYIGDNAGETVFDRVLIEEMDKPVIYAVRERPIINDALREDAVEAGLDRVAEIVSSGVDAPGTILDRCTDEFKELVQNSDFIIAKGQGNYEALSGEDPPIFFLLKAKCKVIADHIGVEEGSIILKKGGKPG